MDTKQIQVLKGLTNAQYNTYLEEPFFVNVYDQKQNTLAVSFSSSSPSFFSPNSFQSDLFLFSPDNQLVCLPETKSRETKLDPRSVFIGKNYMIAKEYLTGTQEKELRDMFRRYLEISVFSPFQQQKEWSNSKNGGASKKIVQWKENEKMFVVPRYWGTTHLGVPDAKWNDTHYDPFWNHGKIEILGIPIEVDYWGESSPYQPMAVQQFLKSCHPVRGGGGVIVCPCGFGKTFCALKIAACLDTSLIFLTTKTDIMDQVYREITVFFPKVNPHQDILRIGGSRMSGNMITPGDVEGKKFVLCTVQSLAHEKFPWTESMLEVFRRKGLLIFDECHHVPADSFIRVVEKITTKFTLGLSADPQDRSDGLSKILYWRLGPIVFYHVPDKPIIPTHVLQVFVEGIEFEFLTMKNRPRQRDVNGMRSDIANSWSLNKLLVDMVHRSILSSYRGMVMCEKPKHADRLADLLSEKCPHLVVRSFHGKHSGEDAEERKTEADILICTKGKGGEGIDFKDRFWMLLLCDMHNPQQRVGRIVRKCDHMPEKKGALIIDVIVSDSDGFYTRQAVQRQRFYRDSRYSISSTSIPSSLPKSHSIFETLEFVISRKVICS